MLKDTLGIGLSARRSASSGDRAAASRAVYDFNGGFGQPFPAGYHPYPAAVLESFRPFVPPDGLARLGALLRFGPVAVLRGPAGAGKQAAALGLLASLGAERFYAVDPDVQFPILDLRLVPPGSGLVLAGPSATAVARLRRLDLERVGLMLAGRNSWLVLTVDDDLEWADLDLAELMVELSAGPPCREVVEVHLRDGLGAARSERAHALLTHPGLAGQLAALPDELSRADAAVLGRLLARYEGDPEAAAERFGLLVGSRAERELVDWFGALPDAATKFFAIALTFAEGEPVETVMAIADSLERAFQEESVEGEGMALGIEPGEVSADPPDSSPSPSASPGSKTDPFRSSRSSRLRGIRALAGSHLVRVRSGPGPEQRAQFAEPDFGDRLLRHVWSEYQAIRPALLKLIAGLGTHPDTPVRRRAVAAVGALAWEIRSFGQVLDVVVEPWAAAEDPGRNEAAALALWAAGANQELSAPIQALIARWVRSGTPGLRATAVWLLSRHIGPAGSSASSALLTEMAEDAQEAVVDAICHALTLSIDVPDDDDALAAAVTVFDLLWDWIRTGSGQVRRVAELTVLAMATLLVRYGDPHRDGMTEFDASQPPDRPEEWPGLLWLAESGPDLGRRAGRLLAAVLASDECGRSARRLLNRWAAQAEPRQHRREALARLLFAAAGHEPARRILVRQAGVWAREPDAVAPRTGALVTNLLNIT